MNTDLIWRTTSTGSADTERIAAGIGRRLKGGEVIQLVSDVGGGKTTFVRGLAEGLGSSDKVASPSFTLAKEYQAGDMTLYHFDFYRLGDPGIMADELAEIIGDAKSIVVVEWADIVENVLPAQHISVQLALTGETTRELTLSCPAAFEYLLPQDA